MKKLSLFLLAALLVSTNSYCQDEAELYKRIYRTADSLNAIGQLSVIDSISLYKKAKELDKGHPSGFFVASRDLLVRSRFNDAAFMYLLGVLRFRYYNAVRLNQRPFGEFSLHDSLTYVFTEPKKVLVEPIYAYERCDLDNFIVLIKLAANYHLKNDYTFFSSKHDHKGFYLEEAGSYYGLATELETHKEKYKAQWLAERQIKEAEVDKAIDEQRKLDAEKKQNKKRGKKKSKGY